MPTAADLMTQAVPRGHPNDTVFDTLRAIRSVCPEEASHIYLLDDQTRLIGQVPIEALILAEPEQRTGTYCAQPALGHVGMRIGLEHLGNPECLNLIKMLRFPFVTKLGRYAGRSEI